MNFLRLVALAPLFAGVGCFSPLMRDPAVESVRDPEMEFATPESQGVDSAAIVKWIDACERSFPGGASGALHGFTIVRHGKIIAQGSWAPFDTLNEPHMLWSHSKSFTSTAIGFLVDDGKLDLDERLVAIFPESVPENAPENLRQVRVRDLLTMNVGNKKDHLLMRSDGDWAKDFMAAELPQEPGTHFRYDSDATYMLSAIVERRSGMRLLDFLNERLFKKVGITTAWTTTSPQGIACGGWGMNMTTPEIARLGQLYLQNGVWNGEQVLSPEWVALATARQTWCNGITVASRTIGSGSDWNQGYGFQFWRCRHGAFRADGASGQLTVVFPEQDAVVSIHAGLDAMQAELNLLWEYLLPAFGDKPLAKNRLAYGTLQERCRTLALKPLTGAREGNASFFGKTLNLKENARGIRSLRFEVSGGEWALTLVTPSGTYLLPVGYAEWKKGELALDSEGCQLGSQFGVFKTAASAAYDANGKFSVEVLLLGATGKFVFEIEEKAGRPVVSGRFTSLGGCRFESAD